MPLGAVPTSAEAATTARRAGELAFNSFVAEPSRWPSSNETSVGLPLVQRLGVQLGSLRRADRS